MIFHNYHTHTHFCDGNSAPERYVDQAILQGFGALGFSGHAPVPFKNNFAISPQQLPIYVNEIIGLKSKFHDLIPIFLSLEMDYIPGITADFSLFIEEYQLDYSLGSVHLVKREGREGLWFIDGPNVSIYDNGLDELFDGNIRLGVESYYHQISEMVSTQRPDIVGHFDKIKMHNQDRYFSEEDSWYKKIVSETLELIKECGSIVEVNTRGLYKKRSNSLFPSPEILKEILLRKIPITLNSDAHKPEELDLEFESTHRLLKDLGFKTIRVLEEKEWEDQAI